MVQDPCAQGWGEKLVITLGLLVLRWAAIWNDRQSRKSLQRHGRTHYLAGFRRGHRKEEHRQASGTKRTGTTGANFWCTAERGEGPYCDKWKDLSKGKYNSHDRPVYKKGSDLFANAILEALKKNEEYRKQYGWDFQLVPESTSVSIDRFTAELLKHPQETDFISRSLGAEWRELDEHQTILHFTWGRMKTPRRTSTKCLLIHEQLKTDLTVLTDKGLKKLIRVLRRHTRQSGSAG